MLSSLAYFAQLERNDKTGQVGDRFETGPIVYIEDVIIDENTPQEILDKIANFSSIRIMAGATARISNLSAVHETAHSLVWCFTAGDFSSVGRAFQADAAIEVLDLEGLVAAIYSEAETSAGVPLSELIGPGEYGDVAYVEKIVPLDRAMELPKGAFVKPTRFADQVEARLVFPAISPMLHDRILITLPRPERFFRKVDSWRGERTDAVAAVVDDPPLVDVVRGIIERIEQHKADRSRIDSFYIGLIQSLPPDATRDAHRLRSQGSPLSPDQQRYLELWDAICDRSATDAFNAEMQPLLIDMAWRARVEYGIRSRFADNGTVMDAFPCILLGALTGVWHPRAALWPDPFVYTIGGPCA